MKHTVLSVVKLVNDLFPDKTRNIKTIDIGEIDRAFAIQHKTSKPIEVCVNTRCLLLIRVDSFNASCFISVKSVRINDDGASVVKQVLSYTSEEPQKHPVSGVIENVNHLELLEVVLKNYGAFI